MHIITQSRLRAFARKFPSADIPLRAWEHLMRTKKYKTPNEVNEDFPSVDFLGNGKTVFNIGGNKFCLVVKMLYRRNQVVVGHVQR